MRHSRFGISHGGRAPLSPGMRRATVKTARGEQPIAAKRRCAVRATCASSLSKVLSHLLRRVAHSGHRLFQLLLGHAERFGPATQFMRLLEGDAFAVLSSLLGVVCHRSSHKRNGDALFLPGQGLEMLNPLQSIAHMEFSALRATAGCLRMARARPGADHAWRSSIQCVSGPWSLLANSAAWASFVRLRGRSGIHKLSRTSVVES